MDKEYTNIDSIIVDLIMDHFNIQTMEGRSTNLSDDDFDRIVDVAESIYLKKVVKFSYIFLIPNEQYL